MDERLVLESQVLKEAHDALALLGGDVDVDGQPKPPGLSPNVQLRSGCKINTEN